MPYNINKSYDDCYAGTSCLINKFDIKNENQLSEVEANITLVKSALLEQKPMFGKYDFEHYKSIHKFLFEDIYEWAGKIRNVDISKKGTHFCKAENIESMAEKCFLRLSNKNYFSNLNKKEFVDEIVDFYSVTNMLHPFREGNGRTQRAFISQLIRKNNYDINFSDIDADELMIATIHSANGVNDYLYEIFNNAIVKK